MRNYNPLNVDELGRNAARKLMEYPPSALPPGQQFPGGGVYTIYYQGDFPPYANMGEKEPIYIGKADLPGKRQGRSNTQSNTPTLYRRLKEHADSIHDAENIQPEDFQCRWLVLDPVWISLTEQVLITEYQPVWNVVVDGFGIHDPGSGRYKQRRSQWDTLHSGRKWAPKLRENKATPADIIAAIARHRRNHANRTATQEALL